MYASAGKTLRSSKLCSWRYGTFVRRYRVLAFESSCDDTCVALLEKETPQSEVRVIAEIKETLNSANAGGVIPLDAVHFHQKTVAGVVRRLGAEHNFGASNPPDLICATRGPGMVGCLSSTLQFAKGLAVAWDRPLVGVHHMLGHLLAATLPSKDPSRTQNEFGRPEYPFLSLLCSGGHTMIVLLTSLENHEVIINTIDIAAGDALDKSARCLGLTGNMIGPELERLVEEIAPERRALYKTIRTDGKNSRYPMKLTKPMTSPKHLRIPEKVEFSFSSFPSCVDSFVKSREMDSDLKDFTAYKIQEVLFDHIIHRINIAFTKYGGPQGSGGKFEGVKDFVCSGGVAANKVLRHKLQTELKSSQPLRFHFPDLALCTDNASMIGNAGIEIFEKLRLKSDLEILAIKKWPMNDLLSVGGWQDVDDKEYREVTKYQRK
ncbi:hypothetical protein PUMCH_000836 [Australozyma saopauloensis]|uniref:N(6)-L-threonylcarbamoyladenine synthase n=1 Tax=Australozyma saopauloensis TaxID=291208 RepID=A0AAX4H771_9ASCO|nr:hypothetical protein PUMCH_000836 [[Candida] saopauloensis]